MRKEGKRLLSIFLSICMLFGLLPGMPVYAENNVENEEQAAVGLLVTENINWIGEEEIPEVDENAEYTSELNTRLTGTTMQVVYKADAEAALTEVSMEELSIAFVGNENTEDAIESGKAEWNVNRKNDSLIDLRFQEVGDYVITYSEAAQNNTITIHVDYPELGFYSEDETYLSTFFFSDENSFYMIPKLTGDCQISENSISFRVEKDGNMITGDEVSDYITIEAVEDREDVYKISVLEREWINIIASAIILENGNSWGTETWIGTEYRQTRDGLVAKDWIDWIEDDPVVNGKAEFVKEMNASPIEDKWVYLAYLTAEEDGVETEVGVADLSVTYNDEDAGEKVSYEESNGLLKFNFYELGDYVITYTGEGVKNKSVTVHVDYPEIGFYTAAEKDLNTFIPNGVFQYSDNTTQEAKTFYMILYRSEGSVSLAETPFEVSDYNKDEKYTDAEKVAEYISYEEMETGVYKIIVQTDKDFGLNVFANVDDGNEGGWPTGNYVSVEYSPKREGLVSSWPSWSEETGLQVDQEAELQKKMYLDLNTTALYLGYLESEEDEEASTVSANEIEVTYDETTITDGTEENDYVKWDTSAENSSLIDFTFFRTGEYIITYPDGEVGKTLKVYVGYPMVGYYTTDEMSDEGFIRDEFEYNDENNSCYVIFNNTDQSISDVNFEVVDYFHDAAEMTTIEEGRKYKITLSKEALYRARVTSRHVWSDEEGEHEDYPEYEIVFRHEDFTGKKAYTDGKSHTGYSGCYISQEEYEKNVVYYNDNNAMYWVHADTIQGVIDKLSKVANGEEVLYKEIVEYDTGIAKPDTNETTEGIDIVNTGYIHIVVSQHGNVELQPQYVSSSGNMKGINFVSGQDVYMTVHDEVGGIYIEDRVYDLNRLRDTFAEAEEIIPESFADTQFISIYLGDLYHVNHVVEGRLDYFTLGKKADDVEEAQKDALIEYVVSNNCTVLMDPFKYPEMHVNIYCDMRFGGRFEKLSIGFKEGYDYNAKVVKGNGPEDYDEIIFTRDNLKGQATKAEQATVTYWDGRTESGTDEEITVWLYDINSEIKTSGSFEGKIDIAETPEPNAMTELTQSQKDAIEQSNKLTVDMKADPKTEAQLSDGVADAIKNAVKDETVNGAYYIDLSVSATVDGVEGSTNITEMKVPMDVTIELPDDMCKKGRKFHVVRHHKKGNQYETHKLDCHMSDDGGKIYFKTDKFSTYAIVYEDEVAESVPQTTPHTHTPSDWVTTKEATGETTGLKEKKCTTCGEVLDTEVIPKFVVELNVKKAALQKGKSTTAIKATVMEGDVVKSWKSSNQKVVAVNNNGKITAKKVGKATITVTTQKGATAKVTITVQKKAVKCTKIKVDEKNITLKVKKSYQLNVTKTPVTTLEKVTYKSSNKKVATVSKNGKITAKKAGKATITVKCGKKTIKIKVTVKKE